MPDASQLALYVAAAVLLAVTPGPGIFYVAARTLAGGRAEGTASSFGTGLGGMVHVLAGSLGVSAIVLASAELFTALKLIGAVYLVWLGFRTFRAARREAATVLAGGAVAPPVGARRAFREGVLVEALNLLSRLHPAVHRPERRARGDAVRDAGLRLCRPEHARGHCGRLRGGGIRTGAAARPDLIRRLRETSGGAMIALGVGLALAKRPGN